MTRRCRLLLGLGCWTLSLIVAPDTWRSIDSRGLALEAREGGVLGEFAGSGAPAGGAEDVRVANTPERLQATLSADASGTDVRGARKPRVSSGR